MGEFAGRRTGESLEARLARLEDIEAIKALKARYAYYCDHGYDADGMAGLFVEDSTWTSNAFGTYHGREAIRAFQANISSEILWALHFMICPVVNVSDDGQNATGSWYLIELATMVRGSDAPEPDVRDAVVMSALSRLPAARYPSVMAFANAFAEASSIPPEQPKILDKFKGLLRRNR